MLLFLYSGRPVISAPTQNNATTEVNEIRLIVNYKVKLY